MDHGVEQGRFGAVGGGVPTSWAFPLSMRSGYGLELSSRHPQRKVTEDSLRLGLCLH